MYHMDVCGLGVSYVLYVKKGEKDTTIQDDIVLDMDIIY